MVRLLINDDEKKLIRDEFEKGKSITKIREDNPQFKIIAGEEFLKILELESWDQYRLQYSKYHLKARSKSNPGWKIRRIETLEKYGSKCAVCGEPARDIHHVLGFEVGSEEYLIPLCEDHHNIFTHGGPWVKPFQVKRTVQRVMELCPVDIKYNYCKDCKRWHFKVSKVEVTGL